MTYAKYLTVKIHYNKSGDDLADKILHTDFVDLLIDDIKNADDRLELVNNYFNIDKIKVYDERGER